MFNPSLYTERPVITRTKSINITALIRAFLLELKEKYGEKGISQLRIRTHEEAEQIKGLINQKYFEFECLVVPQHDSVFTVDFVPSNLGNGYIFYFVCKCERRTKDLYQLNATGQLGCRICHRLCYEKKSSKDQRLRKLLKNPQLLVSYLNSTPKHHEKAAEAIQMLKQLQQG